MNFRFYFSAFAGIFFMVNSQAQNLIVNPGAESTTSTGWTIITQGTSCYTSSDWRIQGNQSGFPVAHGGSYFFFSGCNSVNGEINQTIDVSSLATEIDASNRNFTFSGYMMVYNQNPADGAQMIVQYLSASDNLLVSYNTGIRKDKGVWTQYVSTLTAPVGTRKVKIILKSYVYNGPSVDGYFDDLSLTSEQILPLKLISFTTIVNRSNEVVANWETANEINNDYFLLQRSSDGSEWQTVQKVKGSGTSSQNHQYTATDRFPIPGQSFYRLLQYDIDGKMSASKINTVKTADSRLSIISYPNPARNKLTVEGNSGIFSNLKIFNSRGQNVTLKVKISPQNTSRVDINISELSPGIYFIKADGKSVSFLKQ